MYSGGMYDWAWQVQQTTDGGYIMVGDTESSGAGSFDIGVIKTDENGVTEWAKTYGGLFEDRGQSIQLTSDGGYILLGTTASYGAGGYDIFLVKIDSEGNESWSSTFGGTSWDWGYYVEQTGDGGFIITGCKDPGVFAIWDLYLIKTDSNGNELWSKTFGGDNSDVGHCVKQTSDGGYIVTGFTYTSDQGSDMWLIKTDENGDLEWDNTYGGTGPDHGYSVIQSADEYVVTGYTRSFGEGDYDIWLVKTDNTGNKIWDSTFGGPEDDRSFSIQHTLDNNFVVAGFTESFGAGNYDMWLLKINNSGDALWTKTIGGNNLDRARSVVQTTDGGYILAGDTYIYEQGEYNYYLVKLDPDSGISGIDGPAALQNTLLIDNYPNPFNPITNISYFIKEADHVSLDIYDIKGQLVRTLVSEFKETGIHTIQWNCNSNNHMPAPSGTYFYNLKSGNYTETKKMLLLK